MEHTVVKAFFLRKKLPLLVEEERCGVVKTAHDLTALDWPPLLYGGIAEIVKIGLI
jgi:hypothetical protein